MNTNNIIINFIYFILISLLFLAMSIKLKEFENKLNSINDNIVSYTNVQNTEDTCNGEIILIQKLDGTLIEAIKNNYVYYEIDRNEENIK